MPKNAFHVLLLIETSREYGRGLLRGVSQFSGENENWIIERQPSFYQSGDSPFDAGLLREADTINGIIMRDPRMELPPPLTKVSTIYVSYLNREIPGAVQVQTRDDLIVRQVYDHFYQRGLRSFAFVGYRKMFWSASRGAEFEKIVRQQGYDFHTLELETQKDKPQFEQEELEAWLGQLPKPVGLLACNDDCGQQVITACRRVRLAIPQDVAVVGVDNDEFVCGLTRPPLSSVALKVEQAGYQAAATLDGMMRGQAPAQAIIAVEPAFVAARQSSDILAIADPVVQEAVRYIQNNLNSGVQVNDVQRELAVARRVLYARFKQNLGSSVHQYIKRARVDQIKRLLRETDMTISQIALKMGFPSADHIAKYFRSIEGVNPAEYRQNFGI